MTGEPTFKLPPDGKNPYCFFVFSNFSFFFTGVLGGVYNTGKHSFYPLYSLSPLHGLTQGGGWRKGEGEGGKEGGRHIIPVVMELTCWMIIQFISSKQNYRPFI